MTIRFVDSHCHLDITVVSDMESVTWIKNVACLPISWSYSGKILTGDDLRKYFREQKDVISRLNHNGLMCYYLCGIHPRDIPEDLSSDDVQGLLMPCLDDPYCLGIGEIGLETGSEHEKEILGAHLEMAAEVAGRNKVFGIHTPRKDKARITGELLKMLDSYMSYREHIVVDHCTGETIGPVLEKGFWTGITMNPGKCRVHDLVYIVDHHRNNADRMMLNTDSSTTMYRDLYSLCDSTAIEETILSSLIRENALKFYHLEERVFR